MAHEAQNISYLTLYRKGLPILVIYCILSLLHDGTWPETLKYNSQLSSRGMHPPPHWAHSGEQSIMS